MYRTIIIIILLGRCIYVFFFMGETQCLLKLLSERRNDCGWSILGREVVFQDLSKENRRRHEKARKAYAFSKFEVRMAKFEVIKQQNRQKTLFCCFLLLLEENLKLCAWRKSSSWILLDDESRASPSHVWKLIFIPGLNFFRLILLLITLRNSNIMLRLQNNNKQIRGTRYGKEVRSYLFLLLQLLE